MFRCGNHPHSRKRNVQEHLIYLKTLLIILEREDFRPRREAEPPNMRERKPSMSLRRGIGAERGRERLDQQSRYLRQLPTQGRCASCLTGRTLCLLDWSRTFPRMRLLLRAAEPQGDGVIHDAKLMILPGFSLTRAYARRSASHSPTGRTTLAPSRCLRQVFERWVAV